jgi:hypothetical protein
MANAGVLSEERAGSLEHSESRAVATGNRVKGNDNRAPGHCSALVLEYCTVLRVLIMAIRVLIMAIRVLIIVLKGTESRVKGTTNRAQGVPWRSQ